MRTFLLCALCAVVCWELSYTLPLQSIKYRLRREIDVDEVDPKLKEIYEYVAMEILKFVKDTVEDFSKLIEKMIKDAEELDSKSNNLIERIDKLKKILDQKNELFKDAKFDLKYENEQSVEKLLELFDTIENGPLEYVSENPTEEQRQMNKILNDNCSAEIAMKALIVFMSLRSDFEKRITPYVEGMTSAQKEKQKKLIDWFESFRNAKRIDHLYNTTMEFLELFDD